MRYMSAASAGSDAIPPLAVPLLSVAAFGSGISLRVTDPLLPHLAREFGVSLGSAAQVITAFAISYGVAQLLFGPLGDRFGKYLLIALASFACAASAVLCALAPGFSTLVVARTVAGITAAPIIPLAMAWIGDVVPYQERQAVIARFLIGQVMGLSSGVLVGGLAADLDDRRLPFLLIAVVFVVVGVALLRMNRRLPSSARATQLASGNAIRTMLRAFAEILSLSWARIILLSVFLEGAFIYGAFAFIASHVYVRFDMSLTAAGALVMLFGFGGFVFALTSGILVRRLGERRLVLTGGTLVALCYAAVGLASAWPWVMVGCFLAGIGFYMMHTTLQINATQMAPERRGAAVSAFASCFFLGQSTGVALAGVLVSLFDTRAVMLAGAAGVFAVGLRFAQRLRSRE